MTDAGPLVQLQISVSRAPWRIAPAWSVLAGALAAATPLGDLTLGLRVVTAVVLGDLAWGLLRRYLPVGGDAAHYGPSFVAVLPYAQPDAPLSRLLAALTVGGATWHGVLAGFVLALGGGLLLGLPAVALSTVALLVTVVAWPLARRGDTPVACFALLDVFLPWTLGMLAAGWPGGGPLRWQPLAVAAGFTFLQWSVLRTLAGQRRTNRAVSLGMGVVLCVLIASHLPWAAASIAVLLAPPAYWLTARGAKSVAGAAQYAWAAPWLVVALFVAALALR